MLFSTLVVETAFIYSKNKSAPIVEPPCAGDINKFYSFFFNLKKHEIIYYCASLRVKISVMFNQFNDLYNILTGVYIELLVMILKIRFSRISTFCSNELEPVHYIEFKNRYLL